MFKISKTYTFSAAHQLDYLPDDHPCARLHGHNYTVEVSLEATAMNMYGFVLDFNKLDETVNPVIALLDHKNLNDVLEIKTTSEHLAFWLFNRISRDLFNRFNVVLSAVRVSETPRTWAEYKPNDNR